MPTQPRITPADEPTLRLIVLGASNVHLGLRHLVAVARELHGGPVEFLLAPGHGRSYGRDSSIPGRTLPGILQCGLWQALETLPERPTVALITDVGNDLLYGRTPARTLDWVSRCIDQLVARDAQIRITELPIANLETLGEFRFRLFRQIFFPRAKFSLAEISDRARCLNEGLSNLAKSMPRQPIALPSNWYGMDPIHFRWQQRSHVWRTLLSPLPQATGEPNTNHKTVTLRPLEWPRLWAAAPEKRLVFGFQRQSRQPAVRLADGSTIALY